MAERVNDLLLPIVKGVGSERASQCLTESLQTVGGSGFLQDYPIEQYIRDAKIDSLYEGTTAIQAQDFFFRKIARDLGGALMHVVTQMRQFLAQQNSRELYRPGLESVPFLLAVGDLLVGWLLLRQAEVALVALDGDISKCDRDFYTGKVATAKFFAKNILPALTAQSAILQAVDLTAMELSEEAF